MSTERRRANDVEQALHAAGRVIETMRAVVPGHGEHAGRPRRHASCDLARVHDEMVTGMVVAVLRAIAPVRCEITLKSAASIRLECRWEPRSDEATEPRRE